MDIIEIQIFDSCLEFCKKNVHSNYWEQTPFCLILVDLIVIISAVLLLNDVSSFMLWFSRCQCVTFFLSVSPVLQFQTNVINIHTHPAILWAKKNSDANGFTCVNSVANTARLHNVIHWVGTVSLRCFSVSMAQFCLEHHHVVKTKHRLWRIWQ